MSLTSFSHHLLSGTLYHNDNLSSFGNTDMFRNDLKSQYWLAFFLFNSKIQVWDFSLTGSGEHSRSGSTWLMRSAFRHLSLVVTRHDILPNDSPSGVEVHTLGVSITPNIRRFCCCFPNIEPNFIQSKCFVLW